jgi:hypothetical protein
VTTFCLAPTGTSRSFTIDNTGMAVTTDTTLRAFGDVATLTCYKPGRTERYAAITGGFSSANWVGQNAIDVFDGRTSSGAATRLMGSFSSTGRFFHASVGLPGFGIVTTGGMTFDPSVEQIIFRDTTDVVFLLSPNYDDC